MNYEVIYDGAHSSILKTKSPIDNESTFGTLKEAKEALLKHLEHRKQNFIDAMKSVRAIKETHFD